MRQNKSHFSSTQFSLCFAATQPAEATATSYVTGLTTPRVFRGDRCNGADLLIREQCCPYQSVNPVNRTNRATAGSRVPRMKNSTQMAAGSPRARANLEQTHPPYPPINPISSLFFPLIWTNKVISFIFILFSHTVAQSVEFTLWCICVPE